MMGSLSSSKKLVIFDFDYTLFDAMIWRKIAFKELAKLLPGTHFDLADIAEKEYNKTRRIGYFAPDIFAAEVSARVSGSLAPGEILRIIYDREIMEKCIYPEAHATLKKLAASADLAIFSTNNKSFFEAKFSALKKYFNQNLIYVSADKQKIIKKIADLGKSYEVFIIDDLIGILESVKKLNEKIITVWIKQGPYAKEINEFGNFTPDNIIGNLQDLVKIIPVAKSGRTINQE